MDLRQCQSWLASNFFFWCTPQHVDSQFPDQGLNPCPLQQKQSPNHQTAGKSLKAFLKSTMYQETLLTFISFLFQFLIVVQLIYNIVLVSGVKHSDLVFIFKLENTSAFYFHDSPRFPSGQRHHQLCDAVLYIYILFQIIFPYKLL